MNTPQWLNSHCLCCKKPHSKSLINRIETDRIQKEIPHSQYCILNFQMNFSQFDVACHKHPFAMSRLILRKIRWAAWLILLGTSPHFLNQAFSRFIIANRWWWVSQGHAENFIEIHSDTTEIWRVEDRQLHKAKSIQFVAPTASPEY